MSTLVWKSFICVCRISIILFNHMNSNTCLSTYSNRYLLKQLCIDSRSLMHSPIFNCALVDNLVPTYIRCTCSASLTATPTLTHSNTHTYSNKHLSLVTSHSLVNSPIFNCALVENVASFSEDETIW